MSFESPKDQIDMLAGAHPVGPVNLIILTVHSY
jgi:hypothetical protein